MQPILLKPIVLSVHSEFDGAKGCCSMYRSCGIFDAQIKESSSGFGFVVYTRNAEVRSIVKYDLSHML